jgi:hypothetical protein
MPVFLKALLKDHAWDEILARHNSKALTLYGKTSLDPSLTDRPLPLLIDVSIMDHPTAGLVVFRGMEVFEKDGETRCEPNFYYGVAALDHEVAAAWSIGRLMPSGYAGRPSAKKTINTELRRRQTEGECDFESRQEAAQALHAWFKNTFPDETAPAVATIKKGLPPNYQPAAKRIGTRAK